MIKTTNPSNIHQNYWQNITQLDEYSYFHFITRLWFAMKDDQAKIALAKFKSTYLDPFSKAKQITNIQKFLTNPKKIASSERRTYLEKYSTIRSTARDFFLLLFSKKIWGVDYSDLILSPNHFRQCKEIADQLLNDEEAVISLSTYALNFLVLFTYFYQPNDIPTLNQKLYALLNKNKNLQSSTYFVTHMIINDSLFYTRSIPIERIELHTKFLKKCIDNIKDNGIESVSVDCLCELSFCFKMLDIKSGIEELLFNYLSQQLNQTNHYLTEPNLKYASYSEAEHTNVLYILAFEKYTLQL